MNAPMMMIFPTVTMFPAFPVSEAPRKLMKANPVQVITANHFSSVMKPRWNSGTPEASRTRRK